MDREIFDFCPHSRVSESIPPEDPEIRDYNGWDYTPTPILPYRRRFMVTLEGLRWRFDSNHRLDIVTEAETNAGRLEDFYTRHRRYKPFYFEHEWLGTLLCRFNEVVRVPKSDSNSGGLVPQIDLTLIHHNPEY